MNTRINRSHSASHSHPLASILAAGSAIIVLILFAAVAKAASIGIGSGDRVNVSLKSLKAMRDANLVRQHSDYSCGAAALATILRYGFGDEVTEQDILTDLFDSLSKDEKALRRKKGFSLLDLQKVAQARGYKAAGFRLTPEYLPKLGGPVIVFVEPRGYKHFVVLRGVKADRVYLADPSSGNIRMPGYQFLTEWLDETGKGIIFVVEPMDGLPSGNARLTVPIDGLPQPEIMTIREMLSVGNPYLRQPELVR